MYDLLLQYALMNDIEEIAFLDDKEDTKMLAAILVAGVKLAQCPAVNLKTLV
jgi:hypothetical protein